jgi:preprotein translocase subunit YajC
MGGGAGGEGAAGFGGFIPIILMFVIFYFLLIRPQQKKAKGTPHYGVELKKRRPDYHQWWFARSHYRN